MKSKIFCIIVLLLVSCEKSDDNKLSVEETKSSVKKETVKKIIGKEKSINKTNVLKKTEGADGNRVDKLVDIFDENINVSLMSEDELKEYVKKAIENSDQLHLGYLIHRLKANKQYELAIFVASNKVERSETEAERAGNLYTYALTLFNKYYSEQNYKIGMQAINDSINIRENLIEQHKDSENDLCSLAIARELSIRKLTKYGNDVNAAMDSIRKYLDIVGNYNESDQMIYKNDVIEDMYSLMAQGVISSTKKSNWRISPKNIEQIKKYANSLSDNKIASTPFRISLNKTPLKEELLQALKKIEEEAKHK